MCENKFNITTINKKSVIKLPLRNDRYKSISFGLFPIPKCNQIKKKNWSYEKYKNALVRESQQITSTKIHSLEYR